MVFYLQAVMHARMMVRLYGKVPVCWWLANTFVEEPMFVTAVMYIHIC